MFKYVCPIAFLTWHFTAALVENARMQFPSLTVQRATAGLILAITASVWGPSVLTMAVIRASARTLKNYVTCAVRLVTRYFLLIAFVK